MSYKNRIVYVNGDFVPTEKARISPFDHGILYGDGVYDTVGARNGVIIRLDDHINRFFRSAKAIRIQVPLSKEELKKAIVETVRRNNLKDAYVKWFVTRGEGEPYIDPRDCEKPTLVIFAVPPQRIVRSEKSEKGLTAVISSVRRLSPACGIEPRIKQLNYLNNILTKFDAIDAGVDEAISLSEEGYVTEAETANIFVIREGIIYTPPPLNILEGVTRKAVIEIIKKVGYELVERMLTPFDLYTADEVFETCTGAAGGGVFGIIKISGRVIGDGNVGPITRDITKKYWEMVANPGELGTPVYE